MVFEDLQAVGAAIAPVLVGQHDYYDHLGLLTPTAFASPPLIVSNVVLHLYTFWPEAALADLIMIRVTSAVRNVNPDF